MLDVARGRLDSLLLFPMCRWCSEPLAHFPQWLEDEDYMDNFLAKFRLMNLWQATKPVRSFSWSISKKWRLPSAWGPWFAHFDLWGLISTMRRDDKKSARP